MYCTAPHPPPPHNAVIFISPCSIVVDNAALSNRHCEWPFCFCALFTISPQPWVCIEVLLQRPDHVLTPIHSYICFGMVKLLFRCIAILKYSWRLPSIFCTHCSYSHCLSSIICVSMLFIWTIYYLITLFSVPAARISGPINLLNSNILYNYIADWHSLAKNISFVPIFKYVFSA